MVVANIQGIAIILFILAVAIKLAPKNVSVAGHDAGQLFLLAALPLFFIDFGTSAEYAAGELHKILAADNLQRYAWAADLTIAFFNLAFGALYMYALGVFRDGGGASTATLRYLGPSIAVLVAFLLLQDYVLTVVVSSLSGADQLLSAIDKLDAPGIVHIVLGIGIAWLTCWLTLRGRKDASRVTFVILFTYVTLMIVTFISMAVQTAGKGLPPAPLPQPDLYPQLTPHTSLVGLITNKAYIPLSVPQVMGIIANSVLHGLVALTGLEAVSNGLLFIKNEDASYVKLGKKHLPQLMGVWNFLSGRVGVGRTIQIGFLFWGGLTTALNSHFSNYFNVIDGTNGRTLVGNLAYIGLLPLGGIVLYYFRQIWSALTLSFANMTAYEDMQSTAYRDGVRGVLPVALVYRSPNGNFPRPVLMTFAIATIIMILVGGNTSAAIPYYGIGVFAPIAFMGFSVQRHLLITRPKGYKVFAGGAFAAGCLSVVIFVSQIIGKFQEAGPIPLISFSMLFIIAHAVLLSEHGERTDKIAHHLIHEVSRIEGTMAELLMWQTHMMQTYRHNILERVNAWRHRKDLKQEKLKLLKYPRYEIHYDSH